MIEVRNYKEQYFLDPVTKLKQGVHTTFHFDGVTVIEYAEYHQGKRHGVFREFYDNGAIYSEKHYVNGTPTGPCNIWYADGCKRIVTSLLDDRIHGEYKEWDEDDILIEHAFYQSGKQHGEVRTWNDAGNPRSHGFCYEDRWHGEVKLFRSKDPIHPMVHSIFSHGIDLGVDPTTLTDKDKFALTLRYPGVRFLP